MTLHDKSTSADIAAHIYAPPRYDALPDPQIDTIQDEIAAGRGALLWCIAAAVVCLVTVLAVWVTG